MPATVTLSTTTLTAPVSSTSGLISVASTAGMTPGMRLWVDRELMSVVSLDVDPWVRVLRGVDGSAASAHNSSSTVTIGRGDQFYSSDPVGQPPAAIPVSPYINVLTGDVFLAQGSAQPGGSNVRWWQKVTTTYGAGAFGAVTTTQSPTAST